MDASQAVTTRSSLNVMGQLPMVYIATALGLTLLRVRRPLHGKKTPYPSQVISYFTSLELIKVSSAVDSPPA